MSRRLSGVGAADYSLLLVVVMMVPVWCVAVASFLLPSQTVHPSTRSTTLMSRNCFFLGVNPAAKQARGGGGGGGMPS